MRMLKAIAKDEGSKQLVFHTCPSLSLITISTGVSKPVIVL